MENPEIKTALESMAVEQKKYIDTQLEEIRKTQGVSPETKASVESLQRQVAELTADMRKPEAARPAEVKTVFDVVSESDSFKEFMDRTRRNLRGSARIEFKQLLDWSKKTTITETALGQATSGVLNYERLPGIVPLARRALRIRDLLPVGPVPNGGNSVDFVKENVFTNAASPQTEGSAKAESADTFTTGTAMVRTIAHWIPISRQALDDFGELRRFIDEVLLYGLKLKEETEILSGDNLGDHLYGLTGQATSYAGTYVVANDNKADTFRHFMLELEVANEEPTGAVLNPVDFHTIQLIKDEGGGTANKGNYIIGDPLGGFIQVPTLWGVPVVKSNSMTSAKCLMGNFAMAKIFDRMAATIDISTDYSDYFVKNLVAVRAEERLALVVYRAGSFRYGTI